MKRKFITISVIILVLLSSCASKQKIKRERSETFIADINAFEVDTFHLYSSSNLNNPKINDFEVLFIPRTNEILVTGKVSVNIIQIVFSYKERQNLAEAHAKYLDALNANAIPDVKPKAKNAYSKGKTTVLWGAMGPTHEVDTNYYTNAQYLEPNKPYFKITCESAQVQGVEHVSSPKICLYISPSQWEQIMEACNQEHLVEMTDEILAQAEAF
ncbi:MAG: hypothetical protein J5710_04690 [Treponema sp.]|nr:hypothetical protein [Treponema sp.]